VINPVFHGGGRSIPLTLRAMPTARGLRISVDAVRERVLLTMPKRASRRAALAWAEARRPWVEALLADAPAARPFAHCAVLPIDDAPVTIQHIPDGRRGIVRDGDVLLCACPADRLAARVEAWLKREALALLSADTAHFAARAGVTISRVSVGDPRRRWGSCSSGAAIAYSWRLALAPTFVRRSVAAHEVAHRLHMDHSPAFYAAYARVLGEDPAPAAAWLRRHGAELHLFGRGRHVG
jgi:predicted metal-dependent hydrolase